MEGSVELRNKLRRTHNRSCNELRKERHIEPEIKQVTHRPYPTVKDIGGVGDDLEQVERDADRQDNCIHHEPAVFAEAVADVREQIKHLQVRPEDVVDHVREEVRILEICQQAEVDDHA